MDARNRANWVAMALCVGLTALPGPLSAAGEYWDTATTADLQAGDGIWDADSTALWSAGTGGSDPLLTWASGDDAFFQAAGPSTVTIPAGTIQANSLTIGVNNGVALTLNGPGTLQLNSAATALTVSGNTDTSSLNGPLTLGANQTWSIGRTLTVTGVIGGSDRSLTKAGAGTLVLSSAGNAPGRLVVSAGAFSLDNSFATPSLALQGTADPLVIKGANPSFLMSAGTLAVPGRWRLAHDGGYARATITGGTINHTADVFQLGFNQGRCVVTFGNTATYNGAGRTLDLSNANACNTLVVLKDSASATCGAININTTNNGANQYGMIRVSDSASLTGSSLVVGVSQNQNNANVSLATVNQAGGTVTVNGTVTLAANNMQLSPVVGTTGLQGTYNLAGGLLTANQVLGGSAGVGGQARLNFHGGTLAINPAASVAQAGDFIRLTNIGTDGKLYVYEGGTIDTGSKAVTINQPFLAPTGQGVASIPYSGTATTGYFVAPAVRITRGAGDTTGAGATATADIDPATGAFTGITITNPGTDYTTAPTVVLDFTQGAGIAVTTATLADNSYAGGLTKTGSGTLTLSGVSTYAGNTTIAQGTLKLGVADAIAAGGLVLAAGGTLDASGFAVTFAGDVSFQGGTLLNAAALTKNSGSYDAQSGSCAVSLSGSAGLVKTTAGVFTLTGNQAYTGATAVSGGTFRVAGTLASSGVAVSDGATLAAAGNGATIGSLTLGSAGSDQTTLAVTTGGAIVSVTGANALTVNGRTTIHVGGTLAVGQHYPVVDFAGAIQGTGSFAVTFAGRTGGHLVTNLVTTSLDVVVDTLDNPKWTGAADGNWDTTTTNWTLIAGGTPTTFIQNSDSVRFDDSAAGAGDVSLTGAMSPSAVTVNNGGKPYAFGGPGKLTGPTGLLKEGGGTLRIDSSGNDYAGATTISDGTLQCGVANALSATSDIEVSGGTLDLNGHALTSAGGVALRGGAITGGTLTKGSGAYLVESGSVSAVLAGAAGLTTDAAGAVTLGGANTYSGPTTVQAGTLNLNNGGAAGASAIGTGTLVLKGGALGNTSGGPVTLATANVQTWDGDFGFAGPDDLHLGAGAVTLATNRQVTVSTGTLTVGGAVAGAAAGLTKAGAGTLALNAANTYRGDTRIAAGTLNLGASLALQNSTVNLDAADAGTLNFGSLTAATLGGLKGGRDFAVPTNLTLTVGSNNRAATYSGVLTAGANATVTKTGSGEWTLSPPAGTLNALNVVNSGTLSLTAAMTPTPSLTVNGIFAVNGTPGRFTMTAGTLTLNNTWRVPPDFNWAVVTVTGGTIIHTAGIVDQGFNSGSGVFNLGGNAVYSGGAAGGRPLRMSAAWQSNNFANFYGSASATFGPITVGDWNGVGGTFNHATLTLKDSASLNGTALTVGNTASGTANLSAQYWQTGGAAAIGGVVTLAANQTGGNLSAAVNLAGGVLAANRVVGGTGTSRLNFHGGTLACNKAGGDSDFLNLGSLGACYIYEGMTLDSGPDSVKVAQPLLAPTGGGVATVPVTAGGAGYWVPPAVRITGGGGAGATAVANVNPTNGAIASVTVTNPGTDYTGTPGVFLDRGEGTGATLGTPTVVTNLYSGGLTKVGAGTLALAGVSAYAGPTRVNEGTLALAAGGSLGAAGTNVTVASGATLDLQAAGDGAIGDRATLSVAAGGRVNLAEGVMERVLGLRVADSPYRAGVWGSATSPAPNKDDTVFSGNGLLLVSISSWERGTVLIVR